MSVDISAPPEVVFAHLITPERMLTWMGERAELDARPGGVFAVDVTGYPFRGEYLEVQPPRRVVVSWGLAGSDDFPPGSSQVEFTLVPTDAGTRLELVHRGLPDTHSRTHGLGWTHYLRRLQHAAAGIDPGQDLSFAREGSIRA